MRGWWKTYFWVNFVILILGLFGLIENAPLKFIDLFGLGLNIVLLFGLYSFVFGKKLFSASIWNITFWIATVLNIEALLEIYVLPKPFIDQYLWFLKSSIAISPSWILFGILFMLPNLYAIYQLGQEKQKKGKR